MALFSRHFALVIRAFSSFVLSQFVVQLYTAVPLSLQCALFVLVQHV